MLAKGWALRNKKNGKLIQKYGRFEFYRTRKIARNVRKDCYRPEDLKVVRVAVSETSTDFNQSTLTKVDPLAAKRLGRSWY